jgi:hypothetical protein
MVGRHAVKYVKNLKRISTPGGFALEDFLKTGDQHVPACVFSFQNLKREAIFLQPGDKV